VKQVAQNYKSGELAVVDAPVPRCGPGGVLVRTEYSLISAGTEMMKVGEAKLSLLGKVRARPDQVKKVLETMAQQGPQATFKKVMNKLDSYTPLGYSLCGIVIEVGAGVTDFHVGQRVACAGNQYALHAEINWVPVNLCVPVPDGVDPRHAAFTTVGAIAMQGLRQGQMALGETAVVIGLGLIGQLLVQLLRANGVKVVGVDISPVRCQMAEAGGALCADAPAGAGLDRITNALAETTGGFGADAIFLAAGGSTNEPVELAAKLARDRGRVVDIGKCSLDLPWNAYYEKELDVRFSRSYGPGRYDTLYEEQGIDYPIGYVRWSEGRNLGCFVDLLAQRSIDMEPLISGVKPFAEAQQTYEALDAGELKGIGFLFEYPEHVTITRAIERATAAAPVKRSTTGTVKIGFVGAGNYASTMLLPHLQGRSDVQLAHVATSSGLSAVSAQRKFGFQTAGTDYRAMLADASIDAVFVVTRHSSHASMVCEALRAGKTVFVEKPLAITNEQLEMVMDTVRETGNDRIMVGFNRRFAPMLVELRDRAGRRSQPALLRYLVNAGKMEATSWYANAEAEGTRFCGEGGHFIDTMAWWVGADPVAVSAARAGALADDVHVTVTFADGSVGVVTYTTLGARKFQKETFEVVADGRVARLDNFASATLFSGEKPRKQRGLGPDKGQKAEVESFLASVRTGGPMPVPLRTLAAVTAATIAVDEAVATGATVKLPSWA
jgi:predicted dehydrogenase/threonine dehydrogenase-like Zn-dependent dehydrogenase